MDIIIILIVVLLLFGGVGGGYYGYNHYGTGGGIGIFGLVLIVCLIIYLLPRIRR